ncbi:hypothetical protein DOLIC_00128 [Dolichomitus sp. PSUC_FEM 10030005]|nr:hypothetical protein [Dolichomitus sp. PSUC_FEM 10030005]
MRMKYLENFVFTQGHLIFALAINEYIKKSKYLNDQTSEPILEFDVLFYLYID